MSEGGADLYARLIARHFGKHISSNPTVIVRNMPGAGSAATTNYIFNVSPRDGSEIGLFAGNIAVDPVIGGVAVKYDARKFNWIGAPASETAVCLASKATSFKTFDDVNPSRAPERDCDLSGELGVDWSLRVPLLAGRDRKRRAAPPSRCSLWPELMQTARRLIV